LLSWRTWAGHEISSTERPAILNFVGLTEEISHETNGTSSAFGAWCFYSSALVFVWDLGFLCGSRDHILPMMMRGGKLMGLSSQVLGMRCFSTNIFVSRLSFYTTEEEFKDVFSPFGNVKEARLMRDPQTGRMKGFGFVKYSSQAEAEKAIKAMDGRILRGRLIFVEMAKGTKSK
ncbi:unnamed protein product, partial [Urochloa humidicola]